MYNYWIHYPEHTDITTQGYVGASDIPKHRLSEHLRNPKGLMKNATDKDRLVMDLVLKASAKDCLTLEHALRPRRSIGWNDKAGGVTRRSRVSKVSRRCLVLSDQVARYVRKS